MLDLLIYASCRIRPDLVVKIVRFGETNPKVRKSEATDERPEEPDSRE